MPDATTAQRIATGFNRNHMVTNETGSIDEEFRLGYVADRVDTTATVWLGLTLGCARCHDHKFDAITQRDYYRLFAAFNSIRETGLVTEVAPLSPAPALLLPAFVVLISRGSAVSPADPLYARLWGSAFLPSNHQGVSFRSSGDPVLYLTNPDGVTDSDRRRMLTTLGQLNQQQHAESLDPEITTRIAQYEMAYRMQTSVPELTDLSNESAETFQRYGEAARTPGTFAANCLLARRLAERGCRFIQLYHRGWDQHYNLPTNLALQCHDVDQAGAALVGDLKRRGLLDDTLVVWGGEFGRTTYSQGKLTKTNFGRDHHGRCFTMCLAGGGVKPGITHGETDDYGYSVVRDPVHVHDLNATILRCFGLDHTKLTFKHQGRRYRLTDVEGHAVEAILGASS